MQTFDAEAVDAALDPAMLVGALRDAFRSDVTVPLRHHHSIPLGGDRHDATLLLMPAWDESAPPRHIGIKSVTVHPDNAEHGMPSVQGVYLLLDGRTGTPVAQIDGPSLTARRTAAASALAASYLARDNARTLVVIGTGRLAPELVAAHAAVRPIERVGIWGRNARKAQRLAADIATLGLAAEVVSDLPAAVSDADILSCATTSQTPVFQGSWLPEGIHVDLVGGFRPDMREADDDAVRRATVFVDTRAGACKEAGDIAAPLAAGVLSEADIAADLVDLCRGEHPGRRDDDEITLFKSVGTAIEDLAAAELLMAKAPAS
ncbi:MAG: ornithine cyclodeaminase family protein [Alphaproteobacteria bacterium]|nr:ornithine cyclodeaminase family protein [Alphaproteobacteria bacterium]